MQSLWFRLTLVGMVVGIFLPVHRALGQWAGEDVAIPMIESDAFSSATDDFQTDFAYSGKRRPKRHGWCKTYGLAGGAEATFLGVDFNASGPRITTTDSVTSLQSTYDMNLADLRGLQAGSRVWLGLQTPQWGLVGRYWRLNNSELYFDPAFDFGAGSSLPSVFAQNRIDAYALDFEVQRAWYLTSGRLEASLGVRFASLDHDTYLSAQDVIQGDQVQGMVSSLRDFHGTGATFAFGGSQPLFGSEQWQIFWNSRTSILWGTNRRATEATAGLTGPSGTFLSSDGQSFSVDDDLFIGEMQLGAQWTYRLACPAVVFMRIAGEYQYWDATAGTATAAAQVSDPGRASLEAFNDAPGIRATFVGFSLGFGITW